MHRLLIVAFAAAACGSPMSARPPVHLDGPTDVTFACVTTPPGGTPRSLPSTFCAAPAGTDVFPPDAGIVDPLPLTQIGFVIEQVRGDVSVFNLNLGSPVDSDPFSPGVNGIPVGGRPSSITTTRTGCHVAVANSGSCDLSIVNVVNAFVTRPDKVRSTSITSTRGRILAQPTTILAPPSQRSDAPAADCSTVSETAYVAFPGCNLVARVDLGSGAILDGIRSLPGRPAEIVGADVTCPAECSSAAAPDAGVKTEPTAVAVESDGSRLYIGAHDSPALLVATLDTIGRPTAVTQVTLEGIGGITRIAITGEVEMGQSSPGSRFRFAYVIGTDRAIHVVDVTPGRDPRECDTQIDRRFLHDARDVELLSCFPVGGPRNPPRRAGAVGSGIRLPEGEAPLDIAFLHPTLERSVDERPQPAIMNGVSAVVTALGPLVEARLGRGIAYFINVDDDNYEDVEDLSGDIGGPDIAFALPHTLRDGNLQRRISAVPCVEAQIARGDIGPARLRDQPTRSAGFIYADTGRPGDPFAPGLHRVACDSRNALWELQMNVPPNVRSQLYTDMERVAPRAPAGGSLDDETFTVAWEGPLAFEPGDAGKAGGRVNIEDQSSMTLRAPEARLCDLGMQPGDMIGLLGCAHDADCAGDEKCILPAKPPAGITGMCLKTRRVDELISVCKRLMVTQRVYTAIEVGADHAVLVTRPLVLDGSPIKGCASAAQCTAVEEEILADREARAALAAGTLPRHNFGCELDPYVNGPARCIVTCTTDAQCDAGTVCEDRHCVLGPIPPQACLDALQRYEPRAGDSFVVTSSRQSFPRRTTLDPKSGLCVDDPTLSPLVGNRIRRVEPDCTDTSVRGVGPNPCHLVDLGEPFMREDGSGLGERRAHAMRLRGPGFSFDVTDVAFPLRSMPDVLVSTIHSGYSFSFTVAGGFFPHSLTLYAPFPERIRPSIDGSLWIVDSGETVVGTRGQLLNVTAIGSLNDLRLR